MSRPEGWIYDNPGKSLIAFLLLWGVLTYFVPVGEMLACVLRLQ